MEWKIKFDLYLDRLFPARRELHGRFGRCVSSINFPAASGLLLGQIRRSQKRLLASSIISFIFQTFPSRKTDRESRVGI